MRGRDAAAGAQASGAPQLLQNFRPAASGLPQTAQAAPAWDWPAPGVRN